MSCHAMRNINRADINHAEKLLMPASSSHSTDGLQAIRARAILYQHIREFFAQRQVLEVETPLLHAVKEGENSSAMTVQQSIAGQLQASDRQIALQHSPALAMQQLLTRGCGAIYQICKVFRSDIKAHQQERKHSTEFSMLAWYTPQASLAQLMQDSQHFLEHVFGYAIDIESISYQQAFMRRLDINPHQAEISQLKELAWRLGLTVNYDQDRLAWLELLFCHFVQPTLGYNQPVFLTDFPVERALSAQRSMNKDGITVAAKFDLYIDGLKLVSGQELPARQSVQDQALANENLANQQAVLAQGRILLGLDRLLMLLMDKRRLDQVLSFVSPMR